MYSGNQEIYAEKGGVSGFMKPGQPETWRPAGPMETGRAAKAKNRQNSQQNSNSQSEFTWLSPEQMQYAKDDQSGNAPFDPVARTPAPETQDPAPRNDGGMSTGGSDVRNTNGIPQKGTNMSSSPVNIPGFQRDPFASLNLPGTSNRQEAGMAMIGGKSYPVSEEAMADRVNDDPNFQVNPEFGGNTGKKGDEPSIEDDLNYQLATSNNDVARRAAVLGSVGTGPMGMRRARNSAMGLVDELDDNGMMTGNSVLNTGENDGKGTVITGDQTNDYLNRGDDFLNDVLSGKITLGEQGNEPVSSDEEFMAPDSYSRMTDTSMLMDTDASDANSILQYEDGGANQVQFGQQPQIDRIGQYIDPDEYNIFTRRVF